MIDYLINVSCLLAAEISNPLKTDWFGGIVQIMTALGVLMSLGFGLWEKWNAQQRHKEQIAVVEVVVEKADVLTKKVIEQGKEIKVVKKDVHKVEVATNSMKDALVSVTEKEALARGIKQGEGILAKNTAAGNQAKAKKQQAERNKAAKEKKIAAKARRQQKNKTSTA